MERQVRLAVGLGNPGPEYAHTRHNAGFLALDLLADDLAIAVRQQKHHALLGSGLMAGRRVLLAKPLTYMNLSGQAVASIMRYYDLTPADVVVIHDDLDLAPGRLRVRREGSAGGHKGLASIMAALRTQAITRVKVGIGRPPAGEDPVDYVLRPFSAADWELVRPALLKAAGAARAILAGRDPEEVMAEYNG